MEPAITYASLLASHLNAEATTDEDDKGQNFANLTHPEWDVRVNTSWKKDKIHFFITVKAKTTDELEARYEVARHYEDDQFPSINISPTRKIEAIAADLERRLIPVAKKVKLDYQAELDRINTDRETLFNLCEKVENITEVFMRNDEGAGSIGVLHFRVSSYDGGRVYLDGNVPFSVGLKVLEVVKFYGFDPDKATKEELATFLDRYTTQTQRVHWGAYSLDLSQEHVLKWLRDLIKSALADGEITIGKI